jgi:prepilin peptidase dependent protein B
MNGILLKIPRPAKQPRHAAGFTLVELLVGVALGVFLLFGVVTVFTNTVRGSADNLRSARMNQELSSVMEMIVNDIRRAGYSNGNDTIYKTDDRRKDSEIDISIPEDNCVLYSYDENGDGALTNDRHGFKRAETGGIGRVEFRTDDTDCDADWPDLTDPDIVDIVALEFSTTGSKCLNRGTRDETDPGPIGYWITNTDTQRFPCAEPTSGDVAYYAYNADTKTYATTSTTLVAPLTGHRTVETRQVNVLLTGRLRQDNAVTKELRASVKVRNDFAETHD